MVKVEAYFPITIEGTGSAKKSELEELVSEDQKKSVPKDNSASNKNKEKGLNALKSGDLERARMDYTASFKQDENVIGDVYRHVKNKLREESKRIILERYNNWAKKEGKPEELYRGACEAVRGLDYSLRDVEEFLDARNREEYEGHMKLGIFMSALINRIIKSNETLTLRVENYTGFMGAFHEKGTLVIEPSGKFENQSWCDFAHGLCGGKVIINGAVGRRYGNYMEDGELFVEQAMDNGLSYVKGGHAILKSLIEEGKACILSSETSIGSYQSGGLIEILGNIQSNVGNISSEQIGGELIAHKCVASASIGYNKKGGKTIIRDIVSDGNSQQIGTCMKGGEIIIEGDIKEVSGSQMIGFKQKGGYILVKGDVQCSSIGQDTWPGARIRVEGNVHGHVGGPETSGLEIFIGGNVIGGPVADMSWDMNCTIRGNVHGDVGDLFGYDELRKNRRAGKVEIYGDVYGNVGNLMYGGCEVIIHGDLHGKVEELCGGVVRVDGGIQEIVPCLSGKVYQRGMDVTRTNVGVSVARFFGLHIRGDK